MKESDDACFFSEMLPKYYHIRMQLNYKKTYLVRPNKKEYMINIDQVLFYLNSINNRLEKINRNQFKSYFLRNQFIKDNEDASFNERWLIHNKNQRRKDNNNRLRIAEIVYVYGAGGRYLLAKYLSTSEIIIGIKNNIFVDYYRNFKNDYSWICEANIAIIKSFGLNRSNIFDNIDLAARFVNKGENLNKKIITDIHSYAYNSPLLRNQHNQYKGVLS